MSIATGYRIAEVARRSGFSTSTLRYYEDIGLIPVPARSSAGYRSYDDRAIERLRFIARAKALGCSLEEITDLAAAWDANECGPVKHQLRSLVAEKIADVQSRVVEMMAFIADLQSTAATLADTPIDGPCDSTCGCITPAAANPTSVRVTLGARLEADEAPPVACSLQLGEMKGRLDDWQTVLAYVVGRSAVAGGVRLTMASDAPLDTIARLAAAEHECCSFFGSL